MDIRFIPGLCMVVFFNLYPFSSFADSDSLISKWVSDESQVRLNQLEGAEHEVLQSTLGWLDNQAREYPSRLKTKIKRFYTTCDPAGLQLLVGYKHDSCAAIELAPNGRIAFKKISIHQIEVGVGVEYDGGPDQVTRLTSTIEIKGLKSIEDIPGTYLSLISSAGSMVGGEVNWVMKKLTGDGYLWLDPRLDKTYLEANWLSVQVSIITGADAPTRMFFLKEIALKK